MTNITKIKRERMLGFLEFLKEEHTDDENIRALNEIERALKEKKLGLVFEEHMEYVEERLKNEIPIFCDDENRKICKDKNLPYNFIIEGDNLQALYLLEKTHRGKVDCIYIDPPYNTGDKDWKYNNDYVDENDAYRHSKWLSLMKSRLKYAKRLLNPQKSVLICTIDEKEFLHLGCLLEELFPDSDIQMISTMIKSGTSMRQYGFSRSNEYIFYVRIGEAVIEKEVPNEASKSIPWRGLKRSGTGKNNYRPARPNSFYPIFINKETGRVEKIGESPPLELNPEDVPDIEGCITIWPLSSDGTQRVWGVSKETLSLYLKKGYARIRKSRNGFIVEYITTGVIENIEDGKIKIEGIDEYGGVKGTYKEGKPQMPQNQWNIPSHNATTYGTDLIEELIGTEFPYPKSLYAVRDTLNHVIKNNKNAIILDFFAGSGTTLHAVNLLNAEDNGNRKCILVTNNEISFDEEKKLTEEGFKQGDEEWEKIGIANAVTWPRTWCSINGVDINGNPLEGDYGVEIDSYIEETIFLVSETGKKSPKKMYKKTKKQLYPNLAEMKKSDGFKANVKYFKCDWVSRNPEDEFLSGILLRHVKEMIELENFIELDNEKYVIIFNKNDLKKYILDDDNYSKIEKVWVNQSIIFNSDEMKRLNNKGFKYIPREYFGQELRECGE